MHDNNERVIKRAILDELEISGARYTLCFGLYAGKKISAVLQHRTRENLSVRRNQIAWRLRPRRVKGFVPGGYKLWHTRECKAGRRALSGLAAELIANAQTIFRVGGGWTQQWFEVRCGDQYPDPVPTKAIRSASSGSYNR